jgi:hypothetical protein
MTMGPYFDDGAGNMRLGSVFGTISGTVDYQNGLISVLAISGWGGSETVTYTPACAISKLSQTLQQPVTQSTRGYVYNATLHPIPTPGNLQVSFRAIGKWYTLSDDGSGALVGDTGIGTGSVNFATGTVSVTLGALPDIGSSVLYAWGGDSEFEIRTGDVAIETPIVTAALSHDCTPGTLTVTWTSGGITKTATDNHGFFTGDAAGTVSYTDASHGPGSFRLKPALLPDPTTVFPATYNDQSVSSTADETFTPTASGGFINITAAGAPVRPGSAWVSLTVVPRFHVIHIADE